MRADVWLKAAIQQLHSAGIETARLDALVLLEDYSGHDRGYLLAHPELVIDESVVQQLANVLKERAQHIPLAYLRGKAEFYGREFVVGPGVLVPRPETEAMIDLFNQLLGELNGRRQSAPNGKQWRVADVGTGSGALGITAALEQPSVHVSLLEIDTAAIEIAKTNVINLSTATPVIESDLLKNAAQDYDILLSNLPYVPDDYVINQAATHEPALAIFGGADGLDLYRRLFTQIKIVANKPLYILTEALPQSHELLATLAGASSYQLMKTADFIQLFAYQPTA